MVGESSWLHMTKGREEKRREDDDGDHHHNLQRRLMLTSSRVLPLPLLPRLIVSPQRYFQGSLNVVSWRQRQKATPPPVFSPFPPPPHHFHPSSPSRLFTPHKSFCKMFISAGTKNWICQCQSPSARLLALISGTWSAEKNKQFLTIPKKGLMREGRKEKSPRGAAD